MNKFQLFFEAIKNIKTVGTITFSSKRLVQKIIEPIDYSKAKIIVELGAGNGCITRGLLEKMRPDAILLSFEINPKFCEHLRQIEDDRLKIIEDSAEFMEQYLQELDAEYADYIVSAVPMLSLPKSLSYQLVKEIKKLLRPGSLYIQLTYSKLKFKKFIKGFGETDIRFVLRNVPPARVFVSKKAALPQTAEMDA